MGTGSVANSCFSRYSRREWEGHLGEKFSGKLKFKRLRAVNDLAQWLRQYKPLYVGGDSLIWVFGMAMDIIGRF